MSTLPTVPFVSSPPPDLPETRHDLEVQSAIRGSSMADEKFLLSPPLLSAGIEGYNRPNVPTRKYSGVWWKSWWNRAVVVGLIPRMVYATVALICVALWTGLTIYFTREDINWQRKQISFFQREHNNNRNGSSVALEGLIKNFDPVGRTLNVEWSGLWKDYDSDMDFVPLANGTYPNTAWPIEIYRDTATTLRI